MSAKIIKIPSSISRWEAMMLAKYKGSLAEKMIELKRMISKIELADTGLRDSEKPYLEIYFLYGDTFKVIVRSPSITIDEWSCLEISMKKTQMRLAPIRGRRPKIPWAALRAEPVAAPTSNWMKQKRNGYRFYAELDQDSAYAQELGAKLIKKELAGAE